MGIVLGVLLVVMVATFMRWLTTETGGELWGAILVLEMVVGLIVLGVALATGYSFVDVPASI